MTHTLRPDRSNGAAGIPSPALFQLQLGRMQQQVDVADECQQRRNQRVFFFRYCSGDMPVACLKANQKLLAL
jgi:hypothetical protein